MGRTWLVFLALLPLAFPATSGQTPLHQPLVVELVIEAADPEHDLLGPDPDLATVRVVATVHRPPFSTCLDDVWLQLSPTEQPPYGELLVEPAVQRSTPQPGEALPNPSATERVFHAQATVRLVDRAPAFQDAQYTIEALAWSESQYPASACTHLPGSAKASFLLKNDYEPGFRVVSVGAGSRASRPYAVTVENTANGPSRFDFAYGRIGGDWYDGAGAQARLESTVTDGPNAVVQKSADLIRPPEDWNGLLRIRQRADAYPEWNTRTMEEVLTLPPVDPDAEPEEMPGAESEVPGFEAPLLLLGLGFAVARAARRRG